MSDFHLIVIGAGPGGYNAALRAAELGLKTAVVESREAGGTCLNRGCVPTKTLLHASQVYQEIRSSAYTGITAGEVKLDLEALFARKREVAEKLSAGVLSLLKSAGVAWIPGTATVPGPGTVHVEGPEGSRDLTADHILIATGSVPARPPVPGLDLPGVLTSDDLLEGSDHLFRSIVIIGGGVIGVEFATFYADLGCQVTVLEGLPRLLPAMDRELGQGLAQILKKRGVKVQTGAMVEKVEETEDGLTVTYGVKNSHASASGEAVLCAVGRAPFWSHVFPGDFRPQAAGRAIQVDEAFRTSLPGVYAIGDVSSRIQLAHVASAQGVACVNSIAGVKNTVDLNVVPACVYCRPEIASVGMTEQEAKEAGIPVKAGKCVLFSNARTMILNSDRSFMKVLARSDTREIVGAQLMCPSATDMISQLAQAIAGHRTVEDLLLAMRPHPTFEEGLGDALKDLQKKLG